MKILVVCSRNSGKVAPFITEQADAIAAYGHTIIWFYIESKGIGGYLKSLPRLMSTLKEQRPDIIHAHYGLSGLLANLQRSVPVITTYHGSDINIPKIRKFSKLAILLSKHNIFVSQKNVDLAEVKNKFSLIPCGINRSIFYSTPVSDARNKLGWNIDAKKVLFTGAFDNTVKNSILAINAVKMLEGIELIEMKGFTREQVALQMNAVNAIIMTSHTEGSPQVIKEALACGCPIVSVDVGDVKEIINGIDGCYIAARDAKELSDKLKLVIERKEKISIPQTLLSRIDNRVVAKNIIEIYNNTIKK